MRTLFWRLVLPVTVFILAGTIILGLVEIDRELINLKSREKLNVSRGAVALSRNLEAITRDLIYLAGHSALRAALNAPTAPNLGRLAEDFANFSRSQGVYDQLRWIDATGMEIVRVDYAKGQAVVIPPDKLQDKGRRYYFIDSFRLKPGEIFVSPLDLNVEHDKVEVPYKPIVRVATPVTDSRGAKRGIVILNYYGRVMLDSFADAAADTADHVMMVNGEGYWLWNPKTDDEWGFMFDRPDLSLVAQAPAAWGEIRSADAGQKIFGDGLWTWESVYPLLAGQKSSTGAAEAFGRSIGEVEGKQYVWKSIAHLSANDLSVIRQAIWLKLAMVAALLLALLGFGSWKLARAWAALASSEEDVRRLNGRLEQQVEKRTMELRESEVRYRTLVEWTPEPMCVVRGGKFIYVNPAIIKMFGATFARDLLGEPVLDRVHPDFHQIVLARLKSVAECGDGGPMIEEKLLRLDGTAIDVEVLGTSIVYDGEPAVHVAMRDVTERNRAEVALHESDARYRELFDRNPLPILVVDKETLRFITINQTAIEHYGYSREEFLAMTIADLQVPEDRARVEAELREQYARGPDEIAHRARRHVTKDGRIISADITAQPLNIGNRHARLISVSDVTDRDRAEQELRKLSRAVEQSPASVVITDTEGRIEYVNPMFAEVTGYDAAEVIGRNPRMLQSGETSRESYRELWKTITSGATWRGEFLNRRKNGTLFWERASISPIVDRDGRVTHYIAVKEDVTERKHNEDELRRLNEELERRVEERTRALHAANRELQAFSYSVSHDLRAPLRAISGFSQMIEDGYAARIGEDGRELLARVRAGTHRMGHLIDDLLKLSQISQQSMQIGPVDLSALARQAAEELQATEPKRRVEWVIAPGVMSEGDEGLLRVALQNLMGNAWKYSSKRDAARIEFGITEVQSRREYFVRDNGAGFDMAYADKLFGAFQRLHSQSEFPGTGVGLATVARVVHRHGGEVRAESHVGEGACFYFTLRTEVQTHPLHGGIESM